MSESIAAQIKRLQTMTVARLRERWVEVFGEETRQRNRQAMWKRLAEKIQEQHYGGLSDKARDGIVELRQEFENTPTDTWFNGKRQSASTAPQRPPRGRRDKRLPPVGTVLTRRYRGHDIAVKVLDDGFEFEGQVYRSLSAIAREITGTSWNGFTFFGINGAAKL